MTQQQQGRRSFLKQAAGTAAAVGLPGMATQAFAQRPEGVGTNTNTNASRAMGQLSITELSRRLAAGTLSSGQLVEEALAAIQNPAGEGARSFIRVHAESARATAARLDAERKAGRPAASPLSGIPISLKDLFDEAGVTTLGGSTVLAGQPPAARDALVVERLRRAGAIIIGRTNTVEFAYTGLGINPHYGTPKNVYDRATGRIPGGSTSGGAISVADGMAAGAIGTDTGGSLRIPAALNGLVGFKPTQRRIPLDGVLPLSTSFDSAGPMGWTVEDCALLDAVLAAELSRLRVLPLRGLRFAVPKTFFQDDLSPRVAAAFASALAKLSAAGATVTELPMTEFAKAPTINPRGMITAAEAFTWHRDFIKTGGARYDPRVLARIKTGETITAPDYLQLQALRRQFIRSVNTAAAGYDAMLMPTTPDIAPPIAEVLKDDETYYRINARMLRNPSVVNLFDGCALSVPCHDAGTAPVGLMVAGIGNTDHRLLAVGAAVEAVVTPRRALSS
jgi:aspartyl-tRNA(Asn)/glutamyl-tRNA(Gln) amidotransferase subunit A